MSRVSGDEENTPELGSAAGTPRQPEQRLLLACLRRRPRDIQALVGPDVDWTRLLDAAAHHSVTPLVYAAFKQGIAGAAVPPPVMTRLAHEYYQQAASNGHLFGELRKIVGACGRAGIRVLVLKGTAIAERVYGNIALCPMRDLDFLVKKTDLDAADGVLHELGYTHDESYRWAAWYRDHHHHLPPYVRADGRGIVELHHHIVPPPVSAGIPIEDLWRRARPAGDGALVLCPEDLLLHLCLHASLGHQFNLGLRPVCDISETIRNYGGDIDWTEVRLRARRWGIGKYVYLALRLSRDLLGAAVPDELIDPLRPEGFDPRIIAWAGEQVFADEGRTPSSPLAQLYGPMRLRERIAVLLQSACPSPKAMARLYPAPHDSKRIYLYYPVRWWDLLRKYGRPARRLLRRDDAMTALAQREDQKTALRKWLTPDPLPERSPGA